MRFRGKCLTDANLRMMLDGDNEAARVTWQQHIDECASCAERLERIREDEARAAALMARITPRDETPSIDVSYQRWQRQALSDDGRAETMKGVSWMSRINGIQRRGLLATGVLVALMVVAVAAVPVGTLASDLLQRFRVQRFSAITIPMEMFDGLEEQFSLLGPMERAEIAGDLVGLGDISSTLDLNAVREADSVEEANAHLGGALKTPSDLPDAFADVEPTIYLGDPTTIDYTLNVDKVQGLLEKFGLSSAALPDPSTTESATISLDIPASAGFVYKADGKHVVVGQMESPTLEIPSSIDVELLRDEILSLPFLSPDLVAELRSIDDWEHTLIIPVPPDAETSQKSVNGDEALLIKSDKGAAVLWQDSGRLYVVVGQISGDEALEIADSM